MHSFAVACALLSLSGRPDDFYEPPMLELAGPPPCDDDADCRNFGDANLCNTNTGQCVECLGDEGCEEGWSCGPTGFCRDACTTDADCEGIAGASLCTPRGYCVECMSSADCLPEEYCDSAESCRSDFCVSGEEFCFGEVVMVCLEDGGSTMEVQACEYGCQMSDDGPECAGPGDGTAGPGVTGGPGDSTAGGSATGGGSVTGGNSATGGGSATSAAEGSADAGATSPAADPGVERGCACQTTPKPGGAWAGLLVLGALLGRRRASRLGPIPQERSAD